MLRRALNFEEQPAIRRLRRLAPLDNGALIALERALGAASRFGPRAEIQVEGEPMAEPRLVVSGWAARARMVSDGRQQYLSFLLPGDIIGWCYHPDPLASSTVVALTDLVLCPAPSDGPTLHQVYAMSRAYEEAYLLDQIARLGLFHASERITSLLLEFHERLSLNGMAQGHTFAVPLTQERLADATGLSTVHVNRVLQQARRGGDLVWQHGRVTLNDPAGLAARIGRAPVRVSRS